MALIVQKFGGTSVADIDRIKAVAQRVKTEVDAGNQVAVVVSAMAGVTNQLVGYVDAVSKLYDAREYDVVVSSGEQVTSGAVPVDQIQHLEFLQGGGRGRIVAIRGSAEVKTGKKKPPRAVHRFGVLQVASVKGFERARFSVAQK